MFIMPKFALRVAKKEFRVLLVRQAVSRNVFGLERDGLLQARAPLACRLPRQTEHQIDIDIGKPSGTQNPKRFFRLLRIVLASEQFQQLAVPRLHAETDPVHTEFFEHGCFSRGNASRIGFHCPLNQFR